MQSLQEFEPLPSLDGSAMRAFVRERSALPWFGRDLSAPFVDGLAKAEHGDVALLFYVLGAVPVGGGPFGRPIRARQYTMLEATRAGWSLGRGHVQPRTRWHALGRWFGAREVEVGTLPPRYRATGSGARELLTARVGDALVSAQGPISLAWAGARVVVCGPGRATGSRRDRFVADATAVVEALK